MTVAHRLFQVVALVSSLTIVTGYVSHRAGAFTRSPVRQASSLPSVRQFTELTVAPINDDATRLDLNSLKGAGLQITSGIARLFESDSELLGTDSTNHQQSVVQYEQLGPFTIPSTPSLPAPLTVTMAGSKTMTSVVVANDVKFLIFGASDASPQRERSHKSERNLRYKLSKIPFPDSNPTKAPTLMSGSKSLVGVLLPTDVVRSTEDNPDPEGSWDTSGVEDLVSSIMQHVTSVDLSNPSVETIYPDFYVPLDAANVNLFLKLDTPFSESGPHRITMSGSKSGTIITSDDIVDLSK